ncbi:hypothetical protein [Tenacibaculum jejuense]|uniref:Uncharacterized protein n=1 Tax=Tenacibaculum jejuense TaxID=584609 RepID=A0A238U6A2_9FLAO|nr:hypothetical protein [Tenacibaculum jejuense]SNR14526.1 protein of unknown function [Tenacibaculum jejuense]
MITDLQRKELEKIKPPKYREKVKDYLLQQGENFSLETIQKVYSGKRNNIKIAKAIVFVFEKFYSEKQTLDENIKSIIQKIDKKIP